MDGERVEKAIGLVVVIALLVWIFWGWRICTEYSEQYKGDLSVEMVSAVVNDKEVRVILVGVVPVTKYYVEVEYLGVTAEFISVSLYNNVEVGSNLDVYFVRNKEKGNRLVLSYK